MKLALPYCEHKLEH